MMDEAEEDIGTDARSKEMLLAAQLPVSVPIIPSISSCFGSYPQSISNITSLPLQSAPASPA